MSKLSIGVGEDFPLEDAPQPRDFRACSARWHTHRMHARGWRHRRHMHGAGAIVALPAVAASVTVAILYPLATLGVIGGLGLAAAAYRHGRWHGEEFHPQSPPDRAKSEPPKEPQ
jgi:hypothetical protein